MKDRRLIIGLVLLIGLTGPISSLRAQEQTYPFVRYTVNHLKYDTTSPTMQAFFDRWNNMNANRQGNLNIVHIGGSHVQAGMMTQTIRQRLLAAGGVVGQRGMIFPYSAAARCNNPPDYRVHCRERMVLTRCVYKEPEYPLGLCGIAVTARDQQSEIQIALNEPAADFRTSRVVLLGHSDDGVVPRLRTLRGELYPSYIDNNTDRYFFNIDSPVDSFVVVLPCREGQQFSVTGLCLDSPAAGLTYHSIGVNGAAVPDYLRCPNFVRDLRMLHPDAVVFGIGINDANTANFDTVAFRTAYLQLVDSVRSVNPDCAFIFITNNDSYVKVGRRRYNVNPNGTLARDVFYRLAHDTDGAVWDQFQVMGGLRSMEKWCEYGLAQTDRVHFTRAGYTLVGNLFADALLEALEKSASMRASKSASQQVNKSATRRINKSTSQQVNKSASQQTDESLTPRPPRN